MFKRLGMAVVLAVTFNGVFAVKAWSEPQLYGSINTLYSQVGFFAVPSDAPNPNEVLKIVNRIRAESKLPPVRVNKVLEQIALKRADDMAAWQYYAHKSPGGQYYYDLFIPQGINPDYSCENLDMTSLVDSQSVVDDWLSSAAGHRDCMLNRRVVEAGYATKKLTTVDMNGKATTEYLVVAIHATPL